METWPWKDTGMLRTASSTMNCFDPNGSFYSRLVVAAISDRRGLPPGHKFITWAWDRLLGSSLCCQRTRAFRRRMMPKKLHNVCQLADSQFCNRLSGTLSWDKYLYKRRHVGRTSAVINRLFCFNILYRIKIFRIITAVHIEFNCLIFLHIKSIFKRFFKHLDASLHPLRLNRNGISNCVINYANMKKKREREMFFWRQQGTHCRAVLEPLAHAPLVSLIGSPTSIFC